MKSLDEVSRRIVTSLVSSVEVCWGCEKWKTWFRFSGAKGDAAEPEETWPGSEADDVERGRGGEGSGRGVGGAFGAVEGTGEDRRKFSLVGP